MKKTMKIVGLLLISCMFCVSGWCDENVIEITDAHGLNKSRNNLSGHYKLMENIDLSEYKNWEPIGDGDHPFTGTFNGNLKKISHLTINRPNTYNVGLFGYTRKAEFLNVHLEDVNVSGCRYVGGLVGSSNAGKITNSYATGKVEGRVVGGLVGTSYAGKITNSYATGKVEGSDRVGGLLGEAVYKGEVTNSYATSEVTGVECSSCVGGLVGEFPNGGKLTNSYATGEVNGESRVGGLVGTFKWGEITNSYATGEVNGESRVGGLVGGLFKGKITNSYATGKVSGIEYVGGLVGNNKFGKITNSYWNTQTTGQRTSAGGVGKTTKQMKQKKTYTSGDHPWVFPHIWKIVEEKGYPTLAGIVLIENKCDLKNFIEGETTFFSPKNHFILTQSINMDGIKIEQLPAEPFTGTLSAEKDVVISNLTVDFPDQENVGGLFSETKGAKISNLTFEYLNVTGDKNVGGIAGTAKETSFKRVIIKSFGIIKSLYDKGIAGGLLGVQKTNSTICESCAKGCWLESKYIAGGLVGTSSASCTIKRSFSDNSVYLIDKKDNRTSLGGLVGINEGIIQNSYSSCSPSILSPPSQREVNMGGLVAENGGKIENSYASGALTGDDFLSIFIGGLVRYNIGGTITNSYWNKDKTNPVKSGGGTGIDDCKMKQESTYKNAGWDFDKIWEIDPSSKNKYPTLQWYKKFASSYHGGLTSGGLYL